MSLLMKEVLIDHGRSCCYLGCGMPKIVVVEKRINIDFIKVFLKRKELGFGKRIFMKILRLFVSESTVSGIWAQINGFRYSSSNQRSLTRDGLVFF